MIITNLDAWDRREFIESLEYDQRLQDAEIEGSRKQSNFSEFMIDIFGGLYKYEPKQRSEEDVTPKTAWMDELYNEIKQLPEWNTLRERTKLNAVAASAATAEFCLRFNDAVPDENKKPPQRTPQTTKSGQDLQKQIDKLNQHNQQNAGIDMSAVRRAAREACQSAVEEADKINEALNAVGQGSELGKRQIVAPSMKKEIANRLYDNDHVRKIAELAGRFQRIALDKQKSKTKHGTDEITDITVGDDMGRLVPSEMMKLNHPLLKLDFQKKMLEKSLVQYQLSGREREGRGPLIICCDESGTMEGQRDIWAKAVSLALLRVAQHQKRTFAMIHYDSEVRRVDKFNSRVDPIELIDAISHFTGGGTNFQEPLNSAFQLILSEKEYKKADIVFITDGEATVTDEFLSLFHRGKQGAGFNIISVLINHMNDQTCRKFSDKIVHVQGNNDDEALNIMFDV